MTVAEALSAIRRVGTVENHAGNLRLRFPDNAAPELQQAIDTLRTGKAEALALLSEPDQARRQADLMEDCDPMDTPNPWNGGPMEPLTRASGAPWPEWKAATLNRLFQDQGVTGQPGRITAATVRHGERGKK